MTVLATESQYSRLASLVKFSDTPEYFQFHTKAVVAYESGTPTYTLGTVMGAYVDTPVGTAGTTVGTGNGVMGAITVTSVPGLELGTYTLKIIKANTNAGDFQLRSPSGKLVGNGTVAVAFAQDAFAFTLADGSSDFVVGDTIPIVVTGTVQYKAAVATATDGSQIPVALYMGDSFGAIKDTVMVATTATNIMVINRGKVIVSKDALVLDTSYSTTAAKNNAYAALGVQGILVEASN
jgi:hypothetical protein